MQTVLVTVKLKPVVSHSLSELFSLAAIWGFQVTQSSTRNKTAKISIPVAAYQRMFSEVPKKGGAEVPPPPLNDFMESMQITEVTNV
jgi:hypothetical protein